jgi:uncharacterized RDD family membrane protein YckC
MPAQGVQMPPPTAPQTSYAGFWIRLVASIIDGFILGIVGGIVRAVFGGLFRTALLTQPSEPTAGTVGFIAGLFGTMTLILMAIDVAYYVGLTGTYGATLGKMILGLRVVDANGQKIGIPKAALREIVGKFVSGFAIGLGYLWVAFDEKKQGWHDKIAGTFVVKIK